MFGSTASASSVPADALAEAVGDALAEALADGEAEPDALAEGDAEELAEADAEAEADALAEADDDALCEGLADADPDGDALADPDGDALADADADPDGEASSSGASLGETTSSESQLFNPVTVATGRPSVHASTSSAKPKTSVTSASFSEVTVIVTSEPTRSMTPGSVLMKAASGAEADADTNDPGAQIVMRPPPTSAAIRPSVANAALAILRMFSSRRLSVAGSLWSVCDHI